NQRQQTGEPAAGTRCETGQRAGPDEHGPRPATGGRGEELAGGDEEVTQCATPVRVLVIGEGVLFFHIMPWWAGSVLRAGCSPRSGLHAHQLQRRWLCGW